MLEHNQPDVKERFLNAGSEVIASSPEQLAVTLKADVAKGGKSSSKPAFASSNSGLEIAVALELSVSRISRIIQMREAKKQDLTPTR